MKRDTLKRPAIAISLAAGLLALAGCSAPADEDAAADPVALVTLGRAETGPVSNSVRVYGVVDSGATGTTTLSAPVEATMQTIAAPVGSAVAAHQVVVQLIPSPASRLELAKATADAHAADAAYARAQRLRGNGLASDGDVETARAAAQSADAALASLTSRDQALALTAPAAGYVESITPRPGDLVAAGGAVAVITGTQNLRARFGLDPELARHLASGATVRITAVEGRTFDAAVVSVSPVVDPQTRLATVFAAVPAGIALGPGESLQGDISLETASMALSVPYAALLDDGGQPYVYVVRGGVAHRVDVVTGAQSGGRIAIAKGLTAGDAVVTAGGTALDDGMKVRLK